MKILYMGTPEFARAILASLYADGENIIGVLTQPDKPQGRKMILTPSPVKVFATEHGIPVYQPTTLRDGAFADTLRELDPDVIIVAAYGKILPPYVLEYPKYGCINAHASLLPRHRGAAPIQRAILAGDTVSGVTAMYMADGIDTGDMILKHEVTVTPEDTYGTLHDKLSDAACDAMRDTLACIRAGHVPRTPQDDSLSTYAAKIENEDCPLDFSRPAEEVCRRVRALSPAPLALALMPDGRKLKIAAASVRPGTVNALPGTVLSVSGALEVACGEGILRITELQPEGKKRMDAAAFLNGRPLALGEMLRTPDVK